MSLVKVLPLNVISIAVFLGMPKELLLPVPPPMTLATLLGLVLPPLGIAMSATMLLPKARTGTLDIIKLPLLSASPPLFRPIVVARARPLALPGATWNLRLILLLFRLTPRLFLGTGPHLLPPLPHLTLSPPPLKLTIVLFSPVLLPGLIPMAKLPSLFLPTMVLLRFLTAIAARIWFVMAQLPLVAFSPILLCIIVVASPRLLVLPGATWNLQPPPLLSRMILRLLPGLPGTGRHVLPPLPHLTLSPPLLKARTLALASFVRARAMANLVGLLVPTLSPRLPTAMLILPER